MKACHVISLGLLRFVHSIPENFSDFSIFSKRMKFHILLWSKGRQK